MKAASFHFLLCVFICGVCGCYGKEERGWRLRTVYTWFFNIGHFSSKLECPFDELEKCSCFEVLQLNRFRLKDPPQQISKKDINGGFRKASRSYHPDKRSKSKEDAESTFLQVTSCRDLLLEDKSLKNYSKAVEKLEVKAQAKNWSEDRFRLAMEDMNDLFLYGGYEGGQTTYTPRSPRTAETLVERMHLFLDDSFSMQGAALPIAKEALISISDRIDRTATAVHFIGSNSFEKYRYDETICVDDILPHWAAMSDGTYLWHYIYDQLRVLQSHRGGKEEAVIITDGVDNLSAGNFGGLEGYNHLMSELKLLGIKIRISVLCIGNEKFCMGSHYSDLAAATGGVYSNVDPQGSSDRNEKQLLLFQSHITSSSVARDHFETTARLGYEERLRLGDAKELSWYTALASEEQNEAATTKERKTKGFFQHTDL